MALNAFIQGVLFSGLSRQCDLSFTPLPAECTTGKQLALLRPCDNVLGPALLLVCLTIFISALRQSQYSSMSAELKNMELCKNKVILWTFLSMTFCKEIHYMI